MTGLVSVIVPARGEEGTLPTTLPGILAAAEALPMPAEVLVVAPHDSPLHDSPPVRDPTLRWLQTSRPGKFEALRVGALAACGDSLILVDADVIVDPGTFRPLIAPIPAGFADVVAGRIDLLPLGLSPVHRLLERWAGISFVAWDGLRQGHADMRWALPGALYALRRELLPSRVLVPLVDDASIGLHAAGLGAVIDYAPDARVRTPAPVTYRHWARQKYRSRYGWAALARMRPAQVAALEAVLRGYIREAAAGDPTAALMQGQNRLHRLAAQAAVWHSPTPPELWSPARHEWERVVDGERLP